MSRAVIVRPVVNPNSGFVRVLRAREGHKAKNEL
jgi:hypothetical protein